MSVFGTITVIATVAAGVIGFIAAWRVRAARDAMMEAQYYSGLQQGQLMNYDDPHYLPYHERHYNQNNPYPYQAEIVDDRPIQTPMGTTNEAAIYGLAKVIAGIIERNNARKESDNQIAAPSPVPQPAPQPFITPAPAPAPQPLPLPTTPGAPLNNWDCEAYNDAVLKRILNDPARQMSWAQGAINSHCLGYPTQALYNRGVYDTYQAGAALMSMHNNQCAGYNPRPAPPYVPPAPVQPGMMPTTVDYDYINDMELKRRLGLSSYPVPQQFIPQYGYQQPVQPYGYQTHFQPYGYTQPMMSTARFVQRPTYWTGTNNSGYNGTYVYTPRIGSVDINDAVKLAEIVSRAEAARQEENRRRREENDAILIANARPGQTITLSDGRVLCPYG